tara:strand:- start:890 stop:1132 length:243 start_codon:yes stop_codon:yes gene_type:complete
MPLKKGRSKKVISRNVSEIMSSFGNTGKIGSSKPKTQKKAQKQAAAIALTKAGKSPVKAKTGGAVRSVLKRDAKRRTKIY